MNDLEKVAAVIYGDEIPAEHKISDYFYLLIKKWKPVCECKELNISSIDDIKKKVVISQLCENTHKLITGRHNYRLSMSNSELFCETIREINKIYDIIELAGIDCRSLEAPVGIDLPDINDWLNRDERIKTTKVVNCIQPHSESYNLPIQFKQKEIVFKGRRVYLYSLDIVKNIIRFAEVN